MFKNETYVIDKSYSAAPHVKEELALLVKGYKSIKRPVDKQVILTPSHSPVVTLFSEGNAKGVFIVEVLAFGGQEVKNRVAGGLSQIDIDYECKVSIMSSRNIAIFARDADYRIRCAVVDKGYNVDSFIRDKHYIVRCAVAHAGVGLDVLINDIDFRVRQQVAYKGYGLDILAKDSESVIRAVVAYKGYNPELFVNDVDDEVRFAALYSGKLLDVFIKDKKAIIRAGVACYGFGLDRLVKDRSKRVRAVANLVKGKLDRGEKFNPIVLLNNIDNICKGV
ncbi:hypothetical protein D3C81_11040 [compost metagenome]